MHRLEDHKGTTTQWRLRVLAPRALLIVERHQAQHVGIAAAATGVVPAAKSYIQLCDETARFVAAKDRDMHAGRTSLVDLATHLVSGIALARCAEPHLGLPEVEVQVTAPERLISDAQKVQEVLVELGAAVPGGAAIAEAIGAAIQTTTLAWNQAQEARVALQEHQVEVRRAAFRLNRELVALRRILRAVLGTSSVAYQSMRVSRATTETEDDATELEDAAAADSPDSDAIAPPTHSVRNGAANGVSLLNGEATS